MHRHLGAFGHAAVDADPRHRRLAIEQQRPSLRQVVPGRILCVDAQLDRMAALRQILLRPWQFASSGDSDLRADEIDAGHLFGDRMLDLEPRVHLEKVEASGFAGSFDEKLHGPGVSISRRARDRHRCVTHPLPQRRSDRRRRTLFDHLLVASLNRALALEQVDDVAVLIAEDLELDMSRLLDQPFNVERAVAEGRHGFASCLRDCLDEIPIAARRLHPDAAATF